MRVLLIFLNFAGEWREAFDKIRDNLVGAESMTEVMNDNRNRAMSRATAKRGPNSAMRGKAGLIKISMHPQHNMVHIVVCRETW